MQSLLLTRDFALLHASIITFTSRAEPNTTYWIRIRSVLSIAAPQPFVPSEELIPQPTPHAVRGTILNYPGSHVGIGTVYQKVVNALKASPGDLRLHVRKAALATIISERGLVNVLPVGHRLNTRRKPFEVATCTSALGRR